MIINTALIGFGFSGSTFHAPFLKALPDYNIKTVVSKNTDKVKKHLPHASITPDLEEILTDSSIKLVVIATPTGYHYEHVKKCLLSGKDVVVEKPFTVTSAQAKELINIAKKESRILTVFHNRRWDNDFKTVQEILQKGLLGDIATYEAHFHRFRPKVNTGRWKEQSGKGNGTLYDLGSHLLDQALVLFGMPDEITSDVQAQRPGALATDYFHLILKYGKKRVTLKSSSLVLAPEHKYILHGTKGSFIKQGKDPQEQDLKNNIAPNDSLYALHNKADHGILFQEDNGKRKQDVYPTIQSSYANFYKSLATSIQDRISPPVDPYDALRVIQILESITED